MMELEALEGLEPILVPRGRGDGEDARLPLVETPLLWALGRAGTRHVYGDSADVDELRALLATPEGIRREIDGNTANQPLVRKVVERQLDAGDPREWAQAIVARPGMPRSALLPLLYAIVCARVGNEMSRAFASGRRWEASLQLHMGLCGEPGAARRIGRLLRRMAPRAIVKVPFTPDAPDCLLVARDLEWEGVPVNFTSTFSARQVVAAALFADVSRTNVFMGRLNQGLEASLLGEHVDLEAQRALRRLRREERVRTQLIVASVREWQSFVRVAGCDVFTAPCEVLRDFLEQDAVGPDAIGSRLETSYADELGVSDAVAKQVGAERIAALYRVEPELVEFLRRLRRAKSAPADGEALHRRFEEAGFGDFFHFPARDERRELARGKLPDLDGALVRRIPLDTHYSLLANADFGRHQDEMDAAIEARLGGARAIPG